VDQNGSRDSTIAGIRVRLPAFPMSPPLDLDSERADRRAGFETTHWSVVLAAADAPGSERAQVALEILCRTYWQPLFTFVRRQGYAAADAQDLVQGFFARILARRDLQAVRRERGRFRSYLLGALKNFLVNDWKRASAGKRGGGQPAIPLEPAVESLAVASSEHGLSPDQQFDRQWALALLARVLEQLRAEHAAEGREAHFRCLCGFLTGDDDIRPQSEIAAELGLSEGAVKQAVFRLRQRYQKKLRAEVAHTVATFGDVDQELRHLAAALRS
jgi:RNA polymerase sigma-70 factor (ECF subfamily)